MNVAIIPARGGSKRVPKKNIKLFIGKPIITYSLKETVDSGLFDRVIVSTDSEEIAAIARSAGAEVPFMRPAELSDDHTHIADVVEHAIKWLKADGCDVEYVCCIFCTAPFIQKKYLKEGLEKIRKTKTDSVFTVTSFPFPILRGMRITDKGTLEMFWPQYEFTRSNDLEEAYHDAGQFYWLEADRFLKNKRFFTKDALPIILPRYLVQDIDTPEDWETAEMLYESIQRKDNKKEEGVRR